MECHAAHGRGDELVIREDRAPAGGSCVGGGRAALSSIPMSSILLAPTVSSSLSAFEHRAATTLGIVGTVRAAMSGAESLLLDHSRIYRMAISASQSYQT